MVQGPVEEIRDAAQRFVVMEEFVLAQVGEHLGKVGVAVLGGEGVFAAVERIKDRGVVERIGGLCVPGIFCDGVKAAQRLADSAEFIMAHLRQFVFRKRREPCVCPVAETPRDE